MKQARYLTQEELDILLKDAETSRQPPRDRVMILLSFKAGLRACEIAGLSWSMVTDQRGNISDTIVVTDAISKKSWNWKRDRLVPSGRTIPMHPLIKDALLFLRDAPPRRFAGRSWPRPSDPVVPSERGRYSPNAIAVWFHLRFRKLDLDGASSHSGHRTFITNAATAAGGSIRAVQEPPVKTPVAVAKYPYSHSHIPKE